MNFLDILIILSSFFQFTIVIVVFSKNPKENANRALALFGFLLSIWSALMFFYNNPIIGNVDTWIRAIYTIGNLMAIGAIYFVRYFPTKTKVSPSFLNVLHIVIVIVLFFLIWFTDLFVEYAEVRELGTYTKTGIAYYFYMCWAGFVAVQLVYELSIKGKVLKGIKKSQFNFMKYGFIVLAFWTLIPDVLLPTLFDYPYLFGLSAIGPGIFSAFTAYSILKYRLLGIKTITGKFITVVLSGLVGFILFNAIAFSHIFFWGGIFAPGALVSGLLLTLLAVPFFNFANNVIKKFSEKRLIFSDYNPLDVINSLLKSTSTELGLSQVVDEILNIVTKVFGIDEFGLVIFDSENKKVLFTNFSGFKPDTKVDLKNLLRVINLWDYQEDQGRKSEPLIFDEIVSQQKQRPLEEEEHLVRILNFMLEEKISIIMPLNRKVQLNGLLVLGYKRNDEAFTVQDIQLLESIIANASVAVGRALLYKEVQDFAEKLEDKVDKATKELRDKVKALEYARQRERDLLDVLGHELRTPLSIIKNAIGLIRVKHNKKMLTKEDIEKNIGAAEESLDRELKIVETMLGATKLESAKLELNLEKVDLADVIKDGVEAQKYDLEEKQLVLEFSPPKDVKPYAYVDRTSIQEVFDNLLSNAIKYTNKGKITVSITEKDKFIAFSVKDTGMGIPKKEIKNLGKKFFRVNQYLRKDRTQRMVRPGGSGLGLYVTFGYVEAMGGKIEVESEVGVGSTFTVLLPKFNGQEGAISEKQEKNVFKRMGLTHKVPPAKPHPNEKK